MSILYLEIFRSELTFSLLIAHGGGPRRRRKVKRTETKAKGEEITKSGGVGAGKNVKFGHRDIYMAVCSAGRSETTYFDRARGRRRKVKKFLSIKWTFERTPPKWRGQVKCQKKTQKNFKREMERSGRMSNLDPEIQMSHLVGLVKDTKGGRDGLVSPVKLPGAQRSTALAVKSER